MTVLIFESVTGGGFVGQPLPPSLALEGSAIRRAIVADFAAVAGVRVIEPVDARCLGPDQTPAEISRIIVDPAHPIDLGSLLADPRRAGGVIPLSSGVTGQRQGADTPRSPGRSAVDGVILVAPETGEGLLRLAELVARSGGQSLGSDPEAIALCSDKLALAEHFERAGVPTPPTRALTPGLDWPEFPTNPGPNRVSPESRRVSILGWQGSTVLRNPGNERIRSNHSGVTEYRRPLPPGENSWFRAKPELVVVKPTDGAGAVDTFLLSGSAPRPAWLRDRSGLIVQPFRPGVALSASFLVGRDGRARLIAVGRQSVGIEPDGRVEYRGGLLPIRLDDAGLAPVRRAVESVPGLLGFVGVDFLRDEPTGAVEVIEINPRLTTSIVGLVRLAPPGTIARAWLALASGTNAFDDGANFRAIRAAAPVWFRADGSLDLNLRTDA